jgi:ABC-type protease/lipase transport system fused ATPase/permease subunit
VATREAWKRLDEVFSTPPLHPATMPLPRPEGRLAVEGVTWSPPGAALPVIKEVGFSIEPGTAIALIGPSAAGKSTLARLLVGIGQPQIGRVRLDGADVSLINRQSFGNFVGYLPQDVAFFPGSIRENIARMDCGDPEQVVEAAKIAGAHEMILRLPNGYDTLIGDQGITLSGGQRQRIGLARALYGMPALLVLDEPNAHLDAVGEEALNQAVATLKARGSAIVLITHRPTILKYVDNVLVLNEGRLDLFGPRDEVLEQLHQRRIAAGKSQVRVVAQQGT